MKLKFRELELLAESKNCVLERQRTVIEGERYPYSLYDNNAFMESECKNLEEVAILLNEIS